MSLGCFVAGTDTSVGKTRIAAALARSLSARGLAVGAMKPVASGAERIGGALRSPDAIALSSAMNVAMRYEIMNPYCFEAPVSPHIAAQDANMTIDPGRVLVCYRSIASSAEVVLVEGAGGWLAPIDSKRTMADIAAELALPVVLVVGLRLGCLNHAALTFAAIRAASVPFAGWIASAMDPTFERASENMAKLREILASCELGMLPHSRRVDTDAEHLHDAATTLLQVLAKHAAGTDLAVSA
jgi:dethiobiotin synthetase